MGAGHNNVDMWHWYNRGLAAGIATQFALELAVPI